MPAAGGKIFGLYIYTKSLRARAVKWYTPCTHSQSHRSVPRHRRPLTYRLERAWPSAAGRACTTSSNAIASMRNASDSCSAHALLEQNIVCCCSGTIVTTSQHMLSGASAVVAAAVLTRLLLQEFPWSSAAAAVEESRSVHASAASEEVRWCDEFIFSLLIEAIILPQSFSREDLRKRRVFYCSARRELSNGVWIVRRLPSAASLHNFTPDLSRLMTLTGASRLPRPPLSVRARAPHPRPRRRRPSSCPPA